MPEGLRASDADRQVSLSGWVGRRRDHGGGWRFWICATHLRHRPGGPTTKPRTISGPSTASLSRARFGCARRETRARNSHRGGRGRRRVCRGPVAGSTAAVPNRRSTSRSARTPGCGTGTSTTAGRPGRCPAHALEGQPTRPRRAAQRGLRGGGDPDPDPVGLEEGGTSWCRYGCSPGRWYALPPIALAVPTSC